jgi:hypothetical protein
MARAKFGANSHMTTLASNRAMNIITFRMRTRSLLSWLTSYYSMLESQIGPLRDEELQILLQTKPNRFEETDTTESEISLFYNFVSPRFLRYSFIVLLFLTLESQLNALCDYLKDQQNLPLRVNDLKGDSIARCKTYLHKLAKIHPVDEHLWNNVDDLSKVRNCIVHALGKVELSVDKKRLITIASQSDSLSITDHQTSEDGVLFMKPEYCKQAIKDVGTLFDGLFSAIRDLG